MIEILKNIQKPHEAIKSGIPIRQWKFITFHHTGDVPYKISLVGIWIDQMHRSGEREGYPKFRNGMGYHFLVNRNGEIEYGDRWHGQIYGAHNNAKDDKGVSCNHSSIGIAIVGNYSMPNVFPSAKQIKSARALIKALALPVRPHCVFKATECPGLIFHDVTNWFQSIDVLTWEV